MKQFVVLFLGLTLGQLSYAKDLPTEWAAFEKLTFNEMKELSDVKVDLNQKMTPADLEGKSETEMILMKNSIYAQHGFRFAQKAMANYFLSRNWYKPNYEDLGLDKLNAVSRANLEMFLKEQVGVKGKGRDTAHHIDYEVSQMAYNLFLMGFCTYKIGNDAKAGMVVFEPNGEAKVFHSSASRSAFEPYAYEHYLEIDKSEKGLDGISLMIPARWSVEKRGNTVGAFLTFDEKDTGRYMNSKMQPIIAPGKRLLVTRSNLRPKSKSSEIYPFRLTKQCEMKIVK